MPKAKRQKIEFSIGHLCCLVLKPNIDNALDISNKIHKLCPLNVPYQSNADSDGTSEKKKTSQNVWPRINFNYFINYNRAKRCFIFFFCGVSREILKT